MSFAYECVGAPSFPETKPCLSRCWANYIWLKDCMVHGVTQQGRPCSAGAGQHTVANPGGRALLLRARL